ncbi:carbohydrate ABC transporter permease [Actinospica robiniae]|uniref:carbohydrate ABC transporter permease n=1 Tax=Actinospica robiniae TaxID=304901 RepID=UPI0004263557|nr:carbohydrate ABC transporter permease [Actinospica robiniae]
MSTRRTDRRPRTYRSRRAAGKLGYYTTATALAILFLFPLLWSGWASVRTSNGFGLANYRNMVHYGDGIGTYLMNSVEVTALTVAGTLTVSLLGGYAFGRFRFPGKNALFLATLAILMVPYPTILIPLYVLLGWLGLQNSLLGLAAVLVMFQLPFATFLMRNAFEAVPQEFEDSAAVDGCGTFATLSRVMIHAVRPAVVTVGLFAFLAAWNEFFAALILLNSSDKFTLPLAVVAMEGRTFGSIDYPTLQAGVVFMAIPCLMLFLVLQRSYVRGFMAGALRS